MMKNLRRKRQDSNDIERGESSNHLLALSREAVQPVDCNRQQPRLLQRLKEHYDYIARDLECDKWKCHNQLLYMTGLTLLQTLKIASAMILYEGLVIYDYKPNFSVDIGWKIVYSIMAAAPGIVGSKIALSCIPGYQFNPIGYTDNLIETLEVGPFFYNLISFIRENTAICNDSVTTKTATLIFSLGMMLARNYDPDISIIKNQSMGHKLPAMYNPLFTAKSHVDKSKPVMNSSIQKGLRYVLRSLHLLIPPVVTGMATYRGSELVLSVPSYWYSFDYQKSAKYIGLYQGLVTAIASLLNYHILQLSMRELHSSRTYQFTRFDSLFSAFMLSLFQCWTAIGQLMDSVNYEINGSAIGKNFEEPLLPYTIVFMMGLGSLLPCLAVADNKRMYESFFKVQDKLRECVNDEVENPDDLKDIEDIHELEEDFEEDELQFDQKYAKINSKRSFWCEWLSSYFSNWRRSYESEEIEEDEDRVEGDLKNKNRRI